MPGCAYDPPARGVTRPVRRSAARRAVSRAARSARAGTGRICGSAGDRQSGVRDWDHRRSVRREDRRGLGVARLSQVSPYSVFVHNLLRVSIFCTQVDIDIKTTER